MISCNLFIFFTFYLFISCTSELWLVTLLCSLLLLCFLLLHGEKLWIFYLKVLSFTCLSQVCKSPLPILVFGKSCIFGFFLFLFFFPGYSWYLFDDFALFDKLPRRCPLVLSRLVVKIFFSFSFIFLFFMSLRY